MTDSVPPPPAYGGCCVRKPCERPMRAKWRLPLLRLLLLAIGAAVLEVLCALDIIDRLTMQPPHQIVLDLVHIILSGALNGAILHTLSNVLIACGMALVVGIAFA